MLHNPFYQVISSDDGVQDIEPEARRCYFQDEKELKFYKKYTFINCQMECAILEVEKDLHCIPWHLPKVSIPNNLYFVGH